MKLAVAIQMDPVETIDIDGDSSFVLGLSAQKRGHTLYHYHPRQLSWRDGKVTAKARPVEFRRERGNHATLGAEETLDLSTLDVILMRQDPPFDMSYITATHILERIHPDTLVVNDPAHVRNAPEKLSVTEFENVMPPTLITSDRQEILAFRAEHKDIIVKPLFGNGGAGVFRIKHDDENLNSLLEMHFARSREPLMIQRYEPAVRQGAKSARVKSYWRRCSATDWSAAYFCALAAFLAALVEATAPTTAAPAMAAMGIRRPSHRRRRACQASGLSGGCDAFPSPLRRLIR